MTLSIPPHERAANEFWAYAVREKSLLLSAVAVSNLVAIFLYWFADPVYETRVGIDVGRAFIDGELRGIEKGWGVARRLFVEYDVNDHDLEDLKVYRPNIYWDHDRGGDLVFYIVRGPGHAAMKAFVERPLANLLSDHEKIVSAGRKALAATERKVRIQLDAIDPRKGNPSDSGYLPDNAGLIAKGHPASSGEQLPAQIERLESRLADLALQASKQRTTRLLDLPAIPNPVSPKLILYLFLASMAGIVLGLIGAAMRGRHNAGMSRP